MSVEFADGLLINHILILVVALCIDLVFGEPPEKKPVEKIHPVVWIGKVIALFDNHLKRGNPRKEKIAGIIFPPLIIVLFSVPCLLLFWLRSYSDIIYIIVSAVVLKATFTIKTLRKYAKATITGDIRKKRVNVSKLVSRTTTNLNNGQLNSATVESVAENLTDSAIAPMFYYALLGVFGAMVYRTVNTLDSMVGYKNRKYIYVGSFSAKLDRIMNWLPERIAAYLICVCSGNFSTAWLTVKKYRRAKIQKTIVAMSGALGVRLEKIGCYVVEANARSRTRIKYPTDEQIYQSITIMTYASICFAATVVILMILLYGGGWRWLSPGIQFIM